MTGRPGPPYPPNPPGSNAIGKFTVGVSPIGTIPPFDWWQTVMSQYANSPILISLISNVFNYIDQTANFDSFFDHIWNVDTADSYGLDIWGRIVGINRVLTAPAVTYFGFEEGLPSWVGFNQGILYSGQFLTENFILSDEAYRKLILAKAAFNITDGSIASINGIMRSLWPPAQRGGNAYVQDGVPPQYYFGFAEEGNALGFNQGPFYNGEALSTMTMAYVFTFPLTPLDIAIVDSGVLPKSTGVLASVKQIF